MTRTDIRGLLTVILAAVLLWCLPVPATALGGKDRLSLRAGICITRSKTLFAKGDIREAIAVIESFACPQKAGETGCDHPILYFTLANFYAALAGEATTDSGQDSARARAAEHYRTALEADPGFCEAWLNLAAVSHRMGRFQEAAQAFEKGYALAEPPEAVHLYYAAVCRFQAGNPQTALTLFATLMNRHPEAVTPAWKEVLVHILFALERRREALPHIQGLAQDVWPDGDKDRQKKWQEILIHHYLSLDMDARAMAFARNLTRSDPLEAKWWKALSHVCLKADHSGQNLEQGLSSLIVYGFLTPMTPEEELLAADLFFSLNIPARAAGRYQRLLSSSGEKGQKKIIRKLIQARAMAHDRSGALQWTDTALGRPDLSAKEREQLKTLKKQLLQIQAFYAAAAPALTPASEKE